MENKIHEFFQIIPSDVLSAIARGDLDAVKAARQQLAYRGQDDHGKWIGFDAAKKLHEVTP